MNRENAGYTITDSVRVGEYELVIGEMLSTPGHYVCWYCRGGNDYSGVNTAPPGKQRSDFFASGLIMN